MAATPPLGVFLANHNADSGMKYWDLARWRREIRDIRRMGANTVWFLPMQFGQRSQADFTDEAPHWQLQIGIARAIEEEGLRVGIYQGLNDVFPGTLHDSPEWAAQSGKYFLEESHVCPSASRAWEEILRLRERLFRDLPRIDYLITPATDYGGCSCERCDPWPATYLARFRELAALCRRFHPGVSIIAAGHGITPAEEDELRRMLRAQDWVDYVADIPRGCGKPVIKYYMSPEITMLGGWGKFGPCPALESIALQYADDRAGVAGWVPYSEGVHDDINRFACLRHARNPDATAPETALAYVEEWLGLGGSDARAVAGALVGLGAIERPDRIYVDPNAGGGHPDADRRAGILADARARQPALAENPRYWLLLYRSLYEAFCIPEGPLEVEWLEREIRLCRDALETTEPSFARHLRSLHPQFLPGMTAWCWPRTFRHYWKRERRQEHAETNPFIP